MKFEDGAETFCTAPFAEGGKVPEGGMAIDIGDKAIEEFSAIIKDAKTVLWNGPMGVFEMDCFAKGTKGNCGSPGGFLRHLHRGRRRFRDGGQEVQGPGQAFLLLYGGASLELLEGKVLPGVGALTDKCGCCCQK